MAAFVNHKIVVHDLCIIVEVLVDLQTTFIIEVKTFIVAWIVFGL